MGMDHDFMVDIFLWENLTGSERLTGFQCVTVVAMATSYKWL